MLLLLHSVMIIGSEFAHGNTNAKIASIEAIPSVIQKGRIIDWFEKHKGYLELLLQHQLKSAKHDTIWG